MQRAPDIADRITQHHTAENTLVNGMVTTKVGTTLIRGQVIDMEFTGLTKRGVSDSLRMASFNESGPERFEAKKWNQGNNTVNTKDDT
jgi:hypothetical protein